MSEPPEETISEKDNAPLEPLLLIRVDEDGDLHLHVGAVADGQVQEILVCSAALRRATPTWKTMLFRGFKESKPTEGKWIVSLPADKAAPMLVFMNIIHSRFKELPQKPDLSLLYDICITADKYGLFDLIQPWVPQWSVVMGTKQTSEDGDTIARLTFVSWALNQKDICEKMLTKLVLGCSVNEKGHLCMPDGTCLDDYPRIGPHNLLESLRRQRTKRLGRILFVFHRLTQELLEGRVEHKCDFLKAEECVHLTLGSIWCAVMKYRDSFLPEDAGDLSESLADFAASVNEILSNVRGAPLNRGTFAPPTCNHTLGVIGEIKDTISPKRIAFASQDFSSMT